MRTTASPSSLVQPARSLFVALMGRPFESDWTTTFFRMLSSCLDRGTQVVVWTCGNSTSITSRLMHRPPDPIHQNHTSTRSVYALPEMAAALMRTHPDQLRWFVCQYCMEERGATHQIDGIEIKLPFSFEIYLNQADQALVFGEK